MCKIRCLYPIDERRGKLRFNTTILKKWKKKFLSKLEKMTYSYTIDKWKTNKEMWRILDKKQIQVLANAGEHMMNLQILFKFI